MKWYPIIVKLFDEGYSNQDVVNHFNNPIVTEEYVRLARKSDKYHRHFRRKPIIRRPRLGIPAEGTGLRKVHDCIERAGGLAEFMEKYRKREIIGRHFAKENGIPFHIFKNYLRDFTRFRTEIPDWIGAVSPAVKLGKASAKLRDAVITEDPRKIW